MYAEICFMVYLVRSSHINYNNGTLQRGLCEVDGALGDLQSFHVAAEKLGFCHGPHKGIFCNENSRRPW